MSDDAPSQAMLVDIGLGREIAIDDGIEIGLRLHAGNMGSKVPSSGLVLGVTACELAHQHGTSMNSEAFDHQIIMVQHDLALLFDARIGGNGSPFDGRSGLSKKPWFTERRASDHDSIDVVVMVCVRDLFRSLKIPIADNRHAVQMLFDFRDSSPIGRAFKKVLCRSSMDGQGRRPGSLYGLGDMDIIHRIARTAQSHLGGHRGWRTNFDQLRNNRVHPVRIAEEIGSAVSFFCHLLDRASKIDVDHADAVFFDEPASDFGHGLGIVVPDLHRQRTRFIPDPPQSVGMFAIVLVEPYKAAGVDHFGGLEARAAKLPNDLPEGIIGVSGHGGLQNRRVNLHRTDLNRAGGTSRLCHRIEAGRVGRLD